MTGLERSLARAEWERNEALRERDQAHADAIASLVSASKASAAWQHRAEKAEATLAKVRAIVTGHEAALVVTRVLAALDGES